MKTRSTTSYPSQVQIAVRAATWITLCVAVCFGVTAHAAAGATPTASATVALSDLDLHTPQGLEAAGQRLHAMARTVCDRVADELDLSHHANFVKCVDDTVATALRQIANPTLATVPRPVPVPHPVDVPVTRSAKVSLADLDLGTPEGVRAAHERLRAAARIECSRVEDELDAARQPHFVQCVDSTMAAAIPQIQELARKHSPTHNMASN